MILTQPYRTLERVEMPSLTGFRLVDDVTGGAIGAGLDVCAFSRFDSSVRIFASCNPSGYYLFRHFPQVQPRVSISDPLGRFLPLDFDGDAIPAGKVVRLYPAPQRPPQFGLAMVRALLRDVDTGRPGAWALLSMERNGQTWTGLSDAKGSVAVTLPYPEPAQFGVSSISGGASVALAGQHWVFNVSVRYHRWLESEQIPPAPLLGDFGLLVVGKLWKDATKSSAFDSANLEYGKELILRSREGDHDISELLITP